MDEVLVEEVWWLWEDRRFDGEDFCCDCLLEEVDEVVVVEVVEVEDWDVTPSTFLLTSRGSGLVQKI